MAPGAEVLCSADVTSCEPTVRRIGTLRARRAAASCPRRRRPAACPTGFVYLRDVAPGIAQDMRYAGTNNFTGRPLPGYDAAECVLRRDVAAALAHVAGAILPRKTSG